MAEERLRLTEFEQQLQAARLICDASRFVHSKIIDSFCCRRAEVLRDIGQGHGD